MNGVLTVLAGLGVVGAATHANIMHAGGYSSVDAPLIITAACLLAVGMGFVGRVLEQRRYLPAIALTICILAGEAFWVLTNVEREIASRDVAAEPSLAAKTARDAAETRLSAAVAAKTAADRDVAENAAKPGCKLNCAKMLMAAQQAAAESVTTARLGLEAAPRPRSPTPLSDRLGVPSWAWDLVMAGLRSLLVIGGSLAIGMATAGPRIVSRRSEKPQGVQAVQEQQTPPAPAPESPEPISLSTVRKQRVEVLPPPRITGKVDKFATARLQRSVGDRVTLEDIYISYQDWCSDLGVAPADGERFVRTFAALCDTSDIDLRVINERAHCIDVRLAG